MYATQAIAAITVVVKVVFRRNETIQPFDKKIGSPADSNRGYSISFRSRTFAKKISSFRNGNGR